MCTYFNNSLNVKEKVQSEEQKVAEICDCSNMKNCEFHYVTPKCNVAYFLYYIISVGLFLSR